MISNLDVIQYFKKNNGKAFGLVLADDNKTLLDPDTSEKVCSISTITRYLREEDHCDFETIYYETVSLDDVYRCRQCGTVIFGGDDERYDPNCRCPTCCNDESVCKNTFWTAGEIEASEEKKEYIKNLELAQKEMNEVAAARRKARGDLYDWHIEKALMEKTKGVEIMDYATDNGRLVYEKDKGHSIKSLYDTYIRKYAFWTKRPTV